MCNRNIDILEDYVLSGFFFSVDHFLHVVVPFLPNCRRHMFLFKCSCHISLFDCSCWRVSAFDCPISKLCHPRLPVQTRRQKESYSFYARGFRSMTSHYSSPSVSVGCYSVKRYKYYVT